MPPLKQPRRVEAPGSSLGERVGICDTFWTIVEDSCRAVTWMAHRSSNVVSSRLLSRTAQDKELTWG